eukprot:m.396856 g.396856  ORF g.396856 m.396856 type:complete len:392 (+) comp20104_c10_seq1:1837-3012(+)
MCCWTVPERIAGGFCSGCHGNPETRNMAVLLFVVLSALATAVNAVTWTAGAKATLLRVDLAEGMPGLYSLSVNGSTWLQGMAPAVHCQGQWFRPGAGLTWVGAYPATGSDGYLGQWQALHVNWTAGESMMSWTTSFWYYPEHDSFRFEQVYPDGCAQANTSALPANTSNLGEFDSSSTPSSQFPQWDASNTSALGTTLGYLSVAGRMSHDHNSHGIGLTGYGRSNLLTGQEGGPLALFEVNKSNPATLVLSSMDQFMTGITARVATCEQYAENQCLIEMDVDYRYNDISSLNTTSAENPRLHLLHVRAGHGACVRHPLLAKILRCWLNVCQRARVWAGLQAPGSCCGGKWTPLLHPANPQRVFPQFSHSASTGNYCGNGRVGISAAHVAQH